MFACVCVWFYCIYRAVKRLVLMVLIGNKRQTYNIIYIIIYCSSILVNIRLTTLQCFEYMYENYYMITQI